MCACWPCCSPPWQCPCAQGRFATLLITVIHSFCLGPFGKFPLPPLAASSHHVKLQLLPCEPGYVGPRPWDARPANLDTWFCVTSPPHHRFPIPEPKPLKPANLDVLFREPGTQLPRTWIRRSANLEHALRKPAYAHGRHCSSVTIHDDKSNSARTAGNRQTPSCAPVGHAAVRRGNVRVRRVVL